MVYLIGVNHIVQHERSSVKVVRDERLLFALHVTSVVRKLKVSLIAEEWSEEAGRLQNSTESVLQRVAKGLAIGHRFCDPTTQERTKGNITDLKSREQFWLSRILDCKKTP